MDVKPNKFEEELLRQGRKDEALDSMLSRLNRILQNDGLFKELKNREYFEKPSAKKRRKHLEAVLRNKKAEKKNAIYKEANKGSFRPEDKRPYSDIKNRK